MPGLEQFGIISGSSGNMTTAVGGMTELEHTCQLDIDTECSSVRMTGVICTIGPACDSVKCLRAMMEKGMNICRLNLAHGSYEYHALVIKNIREAISFLSSQRQIAIAVDITGPGIRLGKLQVELGTEVFLEKGHMIRITTDLKYRDEGTRECMFVDHIELIQKTVIGSHIYIEDGTTSFIVVEKGTDYVMCVVEEEGLVGNRHYCNIPGVLPGKPELTRKDKKDIKFVLDHDVDMIFASYIWSSGEIEEIRERLGPKCSNVKVIAKVENYEGIARFDEILEASDGIMVARGNLGIDIAPEKVFLAQKMMIGKCSKAGKPVICATQMLDSMTRNPRPTRAEVADVANAVLDGADCVMLGKETAMGRHPVKVVNTIASICSEAESAVFHEAVFRDLRSETALPSGMNQTTAVAAVEASFKCQASAIFVVTTTGRSAALLSQYRPKCVIVAVTRDIRVAKQLHLYRGVFPVYYDYTRCPDWLTDVDQRISRAVLITKQRGYIKPNDTIVLVTGWTAGAGATNTIRVINLMEEVENQSFLSLSKSAAMHRVQSANIL